MSQSRKRFNRFVPKEEVEWLDRDQRKKHRQTIKVLTDLAVTLEKGGELSPAQEGLIRSATGGSDARDTRLNAAWDMLESTEISYAEKLSKMAPYDLAAYHELINPHEPPASHHYFLCDHLMKVESGEINTLIVALPPGSAKSVSKETQVYCENTTKRLGDVVVGDNVITLEGRPREVLEVIDVPDQQVYVITLEDGTILEASHDHSWPTDRGHICTEDLVPDDLVLRPTSWSIPGDPEVSKQDVEDEVARLCAPVVKGSNNCPHAGFAINPFIYRLDNTRLLREFILPFTLARLTEYTRENGKSVRREVSHPSITVIREYWILLRRLGVDVKKPRCKSDGAVSNRVTLPEDAWDTLMSGETVAPTKDAPHRLPNKWEYMVAGLMIGDGSSVGGTCSFYNSDSSTTALLIDILRQDHGIDLRHTLRESGAEYGGEPCHVLRGQRNFTQWLKDRDLHGKDFSQKRVPAWVKNGSPEDIAYFLSGCFLTDGTLWLRKPNIGRTKSSVGFNISHANEALVKDYVELFNSIGIKARCVARRTTYKGTAYPYWSVILSGKKDIVRFFNKGFVVGYKKERFDKFILDGHLPRIPVDDRYRGTRVVSVTRTDRVEDMRCLRIKDDATFLVNNGHATCNSTYASRSFVQWHLGRNPDKRVLACAHTQRFGEDEFSKPNRSVLDSDPYHLAFPDVMLNPAEKGSSFWRLDGWRGSYAVRGAGAGTSGLRAHLVMADDLYKNAQDALSSTVRDTIWRWWTADVMSRRLPNAPTILVNCLTGETPVLRADGSYTPIADLKVGDELWTYDKTTGNPSVQIVEFWAEQSEDRIYEVHTGNGKVRCNGRHPFWARRYRYSGKWDEATWINASDLKPRDKVLIGGQREGTSESRLTAEESWVLGLFYGDGFVSESTGRAPWNNRQLYTRLAVSNDETDRSMILERVERVFGVAFREVVTTYPHGSSTCLATNVIRVGKWLEDNGLAVGGSAHTKRVPVWLYDQPRDIRKAFLDGFIFADGHRTPHGQVSITLCNEMLTRDIRVLALGLGIKATTVRRYEQVSSLPGRSDPYHSVRFRTTFRDGNEYNEPFYWKGVTSIVDTGTSEKVYDIQVSNTHNFLADNIVVSNTLWHSEDVANKLIKMAENDPTSLPQPFVHINIPAQAKADDPLGREPGEWLWCADQQEDGFYTIQDYITKRNSMPPSMWSALYLGEPLDKFGDFISEDEFQRYDRPPINRRNEKIEWTKTIMSVDTAAKGTERSDYTAILTFRVGVDGRHYLVDVWRGKESMDKIVRVMSRLMRLWEVSYAIIEDSGMGAQILENYQGKMPSPMVKYTPSGKGSKDFRFDAATPWITTGKVLFPKNAPWVHDFINELVAFPNGTNDDQVDAFSQYTDAELKLRVGGTKPLRMRG